MKFCSVSLKWVFLTSVVRLGGAFFKVGLSYQCSQVGWGFA